MEFDRGYLQWGEIDDVTNCVIALQSGNRARRGFGDNELKRGRWIFRCWCFHDDALSNCCILIRLGDSWRLQDKQQVATAFSLINFEILAVIPTWIFEMAVVNC
jgi:hypothetical protein